MVCLLKSSKCNAQCSGDLKHISVIITHISGGSDQLSSEHVEQIISFCQRIIKTCVRVLGTQVDDDDETGEASNRQMISLCNFF